jgi:transcriptional regulatory protein LevR
LIIGVIGYRKFKNRVPAVVEEKPVERIVEKVIERVEEPEKKYEDGYDKKLSDYLSEQIKSKLEEMHSSKIISDSKYSKIKEN